MFAFWFVLALWVAGALAVDGLPRLRALESSAPAQSNAGALRSTSASIQQHLLDEQRQTAASTKAGDNFSADHRP